MDNLAKIDNTVKPYLSFLDNKYVSSSLLIVLIAYAGLAAPKLPYEYAKLFNNVFVKIIFFFLVIYIAQRNVAVALIISVAFVVSLMALNRYANEGMTTVERDKLVNNLEECNGWNCQNSQPKLSQELQTPWVTSEREEKDGDPFLEQNTVDNLHPVMFDETDQLNSYLQKVKDEKLDKKTDFTSSLINFYNELIRSKKSTVKAIKEKTTDSIVEIGSVANKLLQKENNVEENNVEGNDAGCSSYSSYN